VGSSATPLFVLTHSATFSFKLLKSLNY